MNNTAYKISCISNLLSLDYMKLFLCHRRVPFHENYYAHNAMTWLRRLVAGLPKRRLAFATNSVHFGFLEDRVALGQVFLQVLRFSPVSIIPL
jgi:hypothetical protein